MRIATWNINGIRSALTNGGSNVKSVVDGLAADIVAFQETKITRDSLTEEIAVVRGYDGFFSFCRKPKRIGYSGVVSYCKIDSAVPESAEEGLTSIFGQSNDTVKNYDVDIECEFEPERLKNLDSEGRAVITQHIVKTKNGDIRKLAVINTYCPRVGEDSQVGTEDCRLQYKMDFYRLLEHRAKQLVSAQYYLLIVGDFNCSMEKIDHCDPDSDPDFDQSPARLWLRQFLAKGEFVDCFRHLHKDATEAFTCWNTKISARETNFGTRIDYIVADSKLVQEGLISCDHLTLMTGSDHCPVVAEFRIDLVPSNCTPSLCPKNWPQFKGGTQSSLKFYFGQMDKTVTSSKPPVRKKPKMESGPSTLKDFFKVKVEKPAPDIQLDICIRDREVMAERYEAIGQRSAVKDEWQKLLAGPAKPPMCNGHSEPCALRTVKKAGPNLNRQFYVCARPTGKKDNPAANCEHFQWITKK